MVVMWDVFLPVYVLFCHNIEIIGMTEGQDGHRSPIPIQNRKYMYLVLFSLTLVPRASSYRVPEFDLIESF